MFPYTGYYQGMGQMLRYRVSQLAHDLRFGSGYMWERVWACNWSLMVYGSPKIKHSSMMSSPAQSLSLRPSWSSEDQTVFGDVFSCKAYSLRPWCFPKDQIVLNDVFSCTILVCEAQISVKARISGMHWPMIFVPVRCQVFKTFFAGVLQGFARQSSRQAQLSWTTLRRCVWCRVRSMHLRVP